MKTCICGHTEKFHGTDDVCTATERGGCTCTKFEERANCECGHQKNHHHPDTGVCGMTVLIEGEELPCACSTFKDKK